MKHELLVSWDNSFVVVFNLFISYVEFLDI